MKTVLCRIISFLCKEGKIKVNIFRSGANSAQELRYFSGLFYYLASILKHHGFVSW